MTNATIEPTSEQLQRLASSDDESPVVMLNLLRFKDPAAYARYGSEVAEHLDRVGARILFTMIPQECVIGPQEGEWDLVAAVEYPSRRAFLQMTGDPAYLEIHAYREAGLSDSRLIACAPPQE